MTAAKTELVAAGGIASSVSGGGTGVSTVSFTLTKQDDAERLVEKLFKTSLIADAQILSNSYERFYMKYKREASDDKLVKVKLITADNKVASLIQYVKENNLSINKDIPTDILSV